LPDAEKFSEGKIIIDCSQEKPKLKYVKNVDGVFRWITIDGSDSPLIPASMADLENQLRQRDWNITERVYSDIYYNKPVPSPTGIPTTTTTTTTTSTTPLPLSDSDSVKEFRSVFSVNVEEDEELSEHFYISRVAELDEIPMYYQLAGDFKEILISDDDFEETGAEEFCNIYEELMNLKMKVLEYDGSTIDLGTRHYYDIISIRDIERGSSTIDLISLGGSSYTNVLNLNSLIDLGLGNFCTLVVGIEYTVAGKTYSKEHSFIPYTVENENIIPNSFITNISNQISLDFHNNCLRVFSMSKEVTECIISYCYINYEGLF
jgi:hypothetical protein